MAFEPRSAGWRTGNPSECEAVESSAYVGKSAGKLSPKCAVDYRQGGRTPAGVYLIDQKVVDWGPLSGKRAYTCAMAEGSCAVLAVAFVAAREALIQSAGRPK